MSSIARNLALLCWLPLLVSSCGGGAADGLECDTAGAENTVAALLNSSTSTMGGAPLDSASRLVMERRDASIGRTTCSGFFKFTKKENSPDGELNYTVIVSALYSLQKDAENSLVVTLDRYFIDSVSPVKNAAYAAKLSREESERVRKADQNRRQQAEESDLRERLDSNPTSFLGKP